MATLQSSSFLNPSTSFSRSIQEQQDLMSGCNYTNRIEQQLISPKYHVMNNIVPDPRAVLTTTKQLYAIKEAIADRVEMHKNIGEQRSQWNSMLLISINCITLAAATMTAIAANNTPFFGLKLSSTLLYFAATVMLVIMNRLQPSQLAEEQRNAARLFRNLLNQIDTTLSIGHPVTTSDVKIAMENVLALDKAYPLPLIGTMLDKFPPSVEPAVWWPQQRRRNPIKIIQNRDDLNGWDGELEEEMRRVTKILEEKDQEEYIRLGKKALKLNKLLTILALVLTGVATIGSVFVGCCCSCGVVPGALASVVNTIQHGGQVGMVFEMYRNNAGFFKYMKESIESNLMEKDFERRENGQVFEMKLALKLGRSLSELRDLADSYSSCSKRDEFASKLF